MGPSNVPVPPGSFALQGGQEGKGREVEGHIDMSSVANSPVVGSTTRDDGGASPHYKSIVDILQADQCLPYLEPLVALHISGKSFQ